MDSVVVTASEETVVCIYLDFHLVTRRPTSRCRQRRDCPRVNCSGQGPACLTSIVRHERAALGRLKQEATEQTERGSILCFLRYLLLSLEAGPFRAANADFFSCVSRAFRLRFGRCDEACRHRVFGESQMAAF